MLVTAERRVANQLGMSAPLPGTKCPGAVLSGAET
jgi:hypothetical protein